MPIFGTSTIGSWLWTNSLSKLESSTNTIESKPIFSCFEIDKIFSNSDKEKSGEYIGQGDYDPKAVRDEIYYTVNTGEIYLQCVTWSKKVKKKENLFDSLRVSIMNNEFSNWLSKEAYK